jgi:hypothetical protein
LGFGFWVLGVWFLVFSFCALLFTLWSFVVDAALTSGDDLKFLISDLKSQISNQKAKKPKAKGQKSTGEGPRSKTKDQRPKADVRK